MILPTKPIEWAFVEIAGDPMVGILHAQFEVELWVDMAVLAPESQAAHLEDLRRAIEAVYALMSCDPVTVTFDFELEARIVVEEAARRGLLNEPFSSPPSQ